MSLDPPQWNPSQLVSTVIFTLQARNTNCLCHFMLYRWSERQSLDTNVRDESLKNTAALLFSCSSSFSVSDSYTRQMLSLHVWNGIYFAAFYTAMCQIYLIIMHGCMADPLQSSKITHSRCARVGFFVPQPTTALLGAAGRQVSEASIVVEAAAEAKCKHMQVIYRDEKTSSGVIFIVGLPVHYFCISK